MNEIKLSLLLLFPSSVPRMIFRWGALVFDWWKGPYTAVGLNVSGLTRVTFLCYQQLKLQVVLS